MPDLDPQQMRRNYTRGGLLETDAAADPMQQFRTWFEQAAETCDGPWYEPNAMTLCTAVDRQPTGRIVLLKSYDADGFVFYTNYLSRKGSELKQNPHCGLVFWWPWLERQVRVDGSAQPVSRAETEAYWQNRPRGSQLGSAASMQSDTVPSRDELERQQRDLDQKYAGQDIPTPEHWGGFRVRPTLIEFWQGRPDRLHDRLLYVRGDEGKWTLRRLQP